VEMAILLTVLYRRIGGLGRGLLESTIKAAAATAIMAVVALRFAGPLAQVTDPSDGRSLAGMVMFVITLGATGITYLVAAYYLRAPELFETLDRVRSRLRRA